MKIKITNKGEVEVVFEPSEGIKSAVGVMKDVEQELKLRPGPTPQPTTTPSTQTISSDSPKTIEQQCLFLGCTYKKFYLNTKGSRQWYSHKAADGSYHNLKNDT